MRQLILCLAAAACLSGCATTRAIADIPTQLPSTVTLDDKLGVAVETAYQAATIAVRASVRAGFVTPVQAAYLAKLDNTAYTYLCYTRTAYDIANANDPSTRKDGCPLSTKSGAIPGYADSARAALTVIKMMVGSLQAYKVAVRAPAPEVHAPPAVTYA